MARQIAALAACFAFTTATCVALLLPIASPWSSSWRGKLLDLGHVPLLAILVTVIDRVTSRRWLSAALALSFAGAIEVIQARIGRSSSMADFANGAVGVCIALTWLGANRITINRATLCRCAATCAWMIFPLSDAAPTLGHSVWAYRSFPTLYDFHDSLQTLDWQQQQARLWIAPDPVLSHRCVGHLEFHQGAGEYASAMFRPEIHDWSGYRKLCVELHTSEDNFDIHVAVWCRSRWTTHRQRFRTRHRLSPGVHKLEVELPSIPEGPLERPLRHVERLVIWTPTPAHTTTIYLTSIRLEK